MSKFSPDHCYLIYTFFSLQWNTGCHAALADLGGVPGTRPPMGPNSFSHTFSSKSAIVGGRAPTHPPTPTWNLDPPLVNVFTEQHKIFIRVKIIRIIGTSIDFKLPIIDDSIWPMLQSYVYSTYFKGYWLF